MAYELKKRKTILANIRADVVNLHPAMRTFNDSFIVLNPAYLGQNYTGSQLHQRITYFVSI